MGQRPLGGGDREIGARLGRGGKAAGLDAGHLEDPVGGNAVPLLIVFVGHDLRGDVESGPGNLDPLHCPHPLPSPLWPRSPQTFLTLLPDIS